jgi:hypothetical protein
MYKSVLKHGKRYMRDSGKEITIFSSPNGLSISASNTKDETEVNELSDDEKDKLGEFIEFLCSKIVHPDFTYRVSGEDGPVMIKKSDLM